VGQKQLEIGWVLLRSFWGQGYATEIGQSGLDHALGADEDVAFTEARDARSRAVVERLGFRYSQDYVSEEDGVPCVLYRISQPS
jgi:RimJ/RimL family protein N-acetyltransferase